MALALAAIVGFVVYHFVSASPAAPTASHTGAATRERDKAPPDVHALTRADDADQWRGDPALGHRELLGDAHTASGKQIYEGIVSAGSSKHWTEKQAVSLMLGNPEGVALTVNGKEPGPGRFHPAGHAHSRAGHQDLQLTGPSARSFRRDRVARLQRSPGAVARTELP